VPARSRSPPSLVECQRHGLADDQHDEDEEEGLAGALCRPARAEEDDAAVAEATIVEPRAPDEADTDEEPEAEDG
jgi:hypothetical protein